MGQMHSGYPDYYYVDDDEDEFTECSMAAAFIFLGLMSQSITFFGMMESIQAGMDREITLTLAFFVATQIAFLCKFIEWMGFDNRPSPSVNHDQVQIPRELVL